MTERISKQGTGYFIIKLDLELRRLNLTRFDTSEFQKAEGFYNE
jgi:hypothetical protein